MALEPEATFELLEALTDYKIEMLKHYKKYYNIDAFAYHDDVATERDLFMSPETYRALIKPLHKRMADACWEEGVIPIQHTCGKSDAIVQDMIDEGNAGWNAVQATNDIEGMIEKHGDEFTLIGGFNSNGPPGQLTATEDEVRAEVRRCVNTYGKYGKGYIFSGGIVASIDEENPTQVYKGNLWIIDEFKKIRAENEALS